MGSIFQGYSTSSGSRRRSVFLQDKRNIRFARTTEAGRELTVVELRDSKDALVVFNIHVFDKDAKGMYALQVYESEIPDVEPLHGK